MAVFLLLCVLASNSECALRITHHHQTFGVSGVCPRGNNRLYSVRLWHADISGQHRWSTQPPSTQLTDIITIITKFAGGGYRKRSAGASVRHSDRLNRVL